MKKVLVSLIFLNLSVVGLFSAALAEDTMTARVNISTASMEELLTIPGVGDKIAKELEEYQPYTSKEQFEAELGKYLSTDEVAALEQHITLGLVDLNTASKEDLMKIPGIGDKISNEIAEYRPYTSWEQFRTEIGKYLSPEEVSALEFYVTFSQ
jgi:DNA uptake protein ComE-like DNA-binding protein